MEEHAGNQEEVVAKVRDIDRKLKSQRERETGKRLRRCALNIRISGTRASPRRGRFVDVASRRPFSLPQSSYLPTSTLRSTALAMA